MTIQSSSQLTHAKIALSILALFYSMFVPVFIFTYYFDAVMVLVLSCIILYKVRENAPLFLMFIFILYCNYSIVIGEYIFNSFLGTPFTEAKNISIYGFTIRILFLSFFIFTLYYKPLPFNKDEIWSGIRDNGYIFYGILFLLVCILIFGVDRTSVSDAYTVRISPLFEYSKILFLLAYAYSGHKLNRKIVFSLLLGIFILQDVYYGGRITSLQLVFVFCVTVLIDKLKAKYILSLAATGIVFNQLIRVYRNTFSLSFKSIMNAFIEMFESFFVFDTATFSYYASATHVASSNEVEPALRLTSFFDFIKSVITGIDSELSDVTTYVSENHFSNYGGGLTFTHFYFWLGWLGVIIVAIYILFVMNKSNKLKYGYEKVLFLSFVVNSPRWYLYSPNALFRSALVITIILYLFFNVIDELYKNKGRVNLKNIL